MVRRGGRRTSMREEPMYRVNFVQEAKYGHFADLLRSCEELNEIARSRGWKEGRFWTPTAGRANELVVEFEYDTLADYQRETEAFYSDPECMKVLRQSSDYVVQGSARTRIYETAPHLA